MPFDWREFLIIAEEMRNDPREGAQRTCLGRVYYYIYNLGLTKARTLNFQERPPGLHKKLWNWCQKQANPVLKQLGVYGLRMLSVRIDADYEAALIPDLAGEVEMQLSRAQAFEVLLAQLDRPSPPAH